MVGPWISEPCSSVMAGGGSCQGLSLLRDGNANKGSLAVQFDVFLAAGSYVVELGFAAGAGRASRLRVIIIDGQGSSVRFVDQRDGSQLDNGFVVLGSVSVTAASASSSGPQLFVFVDNSGTSGEVVVDALRVSCAGTQAPTVSPTARPSAVPTPAPTGLPTTMPTGVPTGTPTQVPTQGPTGSPSPSPTMEPTRPPSAVPTGLPTMLPTLAPSTSPTAAPTRTAELVCAGGPRSRRSTEYR